MLGHTKPGEIAIEGSHRKDEENERTLRPIYTLTKVLKSYLMLLVRQPPSAGTLITAYGLMAIVGYRLFTQGDRNIAQLTD